MRPYFLCPARSGRPCAKWGWGVGENGVGAGSAWNSGAGTGVQLPVHDALDTDLDAYLDRELFTQPEPELTPAQDAGKPAERLQGVLALAAEEEQWLRTLPPPEPPQENSKDLDGGECPVPEHLKVKAAPVVTAPVPVEPLVPMAPYIPLQATLPGLTAIPTQAQPWNASAVAAPPAPRRGRWLVAGALMGMSTAGVLAASLLWMARDTLPERAQVHRAQVPSGAVTAAPPTHAPERTIFVERSPLQRQPEPLLVEWSAAGTLLGPVVPGRVAASQASQPKGAAALEQKPATPEPKGEPVTQGVASRPQLSEVTGAMARATQRLGQLSPVAESSAPEVVRSSKPALTASVKAEAVKPRETAQGRRAAAEAKPQPPQAVSAPVAKATPAPPAPSKPREYEDLDEDFAREMGFTPGSTPKVPKTTGVTSVWIPPDPASDLPESLTPEQIQRVVVANQPAIVSCIKRFKDTVPGVSGGKFVVRWFVHPDGSTYGQMVETRELRGTPLGTCIERLVPSWKFPRHRVKQQEPVRFPFIF